MKKVAKYTAFSLFALLLLAFSIPFFFKEKIVKIVKEEINKNVAAKVEFKDVSLSLLRHFPKLSIGLEAISVTGINEFEKDTLISADRIDASVNLMSVIRGSNMKVHGVYLQSPRIHALVNKEGKANWEITKNNPATATDESSPFAVKLEKYSIENGYIYYRDESSAMQAEITGLDHEGSGDFTQDVFTLYTRTRAGTTHFTYAGIPYLINAHTAINAGFDINNKTGKYSFKKAAIAVNDLKLVADGFMQLVNDSTYTMDIHFDAPSNAFKNILSLVPAVYKSDFDQLKTSGTAAFKGFVKGTYSPRQLPAYTVDLQIKDGFFQYPDLPQPVKNIQLTAQVTNPDGVPDHTVVAVSKGHLEMGPEPFDFRLLFKNPETSPYVDASVKGNLNLAEVTRFVKLEAGTQLSGRLFADVFAKGTLAALEQQKGPFSAGGFLEIQNLYYRSKAFPQAVQKGNFKIQLKNSSGLPDATSITVSSGHVEVGNDPVDFSLNVNRPFSAIDVTGTAKGRFTLDNIRQFMALEPGTSIKGRVDADISFSGSKADVDQKNYERIHTTGLVNLSNVRYASKEYPEGVEVQTAQFRFTPQNVVLNHLDSRFKNTRFSADGVLNNIIGYALRDQELGGTVNVAADQLNLNDWMGSDTVAANSTAASEPFLVPANLNITVHAKAGAVHYDKVRYNNVRGSLLVKEEAVRLQNVQTEALDGTIGFDGWYSTRQHKTKPQISLQYTIKEVDVQKAFYAYNTIQKLMPVGKFLSGKLSSQFSMVGQLKGDLFPDLGSLTGNGNLLLIQGVLSKFQPLDQLASTLNIAELKDISLKDIKSHFEFVNGKVLVKPFNLKVKDIDMQIGGMHGLDQGLDYLIGMKVPRKYLGATGNAFINNLAAQANSKGIPVNVAEVVDLNVKIGGTITRPVIKADLKEAAGDVTKELKQQAVAFVQQKAEEAKQTVKDSLTVVKKQVLQDVKGELTKQITGSADSMGKGTSLHNTKEKATETLKNTLGGLFKKKKAAADTTNTINK